jgi:hypothetical protein
VIRETLTIRRNLDRGVYGTASLCAPAKIACTGS